MFLPQLVWVLGQFCFGQSDKDVAISVVSLQHLIGTQTFVTDGCSLKLDFLVNRCYVSWDEEIVDFFTSYKNKGNMKVVLYPICALIALFVDLTSFIG